jgi:hypothetical protein
MPLTVYARHAHAMSAEEMPIGKIVELEHDGRVGRAVIDIVDDGRFGTQTQRLVKAKMLNAVSLRSEEFELEDAKVNGQMVLEAKVLQLAGIDFAPDGPAQPTFGIEVLAAEAVVEHNPPPDEEDDQHMEITLERVRAEAPAIIQEIEKPLREQITSLTAERDSTITERDELRGKVIELEKATAKSEADAEVAKLAAEFPKPADALKVLQDKCKDCANAAEVRGTVAPILLDALKHATKPVETTGDDFPAGEPEPLPAVAGAAHRQPRQAPGDRPGRHHRRRVAPDQLRPGDGAARVRDHQRHGLGHDPGPPRTDGLRVLRRLLARR